MADKAPDLLRVGKTGFYTFIFKNNGNIDIPYAKAGIQFLDFTEITNVKINDSNVFSINDINTLFEEDLLGDEESEELDVWIEEDELKIIPLIISDLKPGDQMSVDVTVRNFIDSSFPRSEARRVGKECMCWLARE